MPTMFYCLGTDVLNNLTLPALKSRPTHSGYSFKHWYKYIRFQSNLNVFAIENLLSSFYIITFLKEASQNEKRKNNLVNIASSYRPYHLNTFKKSIETTRPMHFLTIRWVLFIVNNIFSFSYIEERVRSKKFRSIF